jgi:hypothetical protein
MSGGAPTTMGGVFWVCGISRASEVLDHHKMPHPAGEDGLSGWLPAQLANLLAATTLLLHTEPPPLPEKFSLLLGASSP